MNPDQGSLFAVLVLVALLVTLAAIAESRRGTALQTGTLTGPPGGVTRLRRAGTVLLVGAWFGLAAGVCQLLIAGFNRYVRHHLILASHEIIWMAPLSSVIIFLAIGIALVPLALLFRRLTTSVAVFIFAALSTFSLLAPFEQLHVGAAALLAAGVGVYFAQLVRRNPAGWLRGMLRSGAALTIAVVMVTLGVRARGVWVKRGIIASLPVSMPDAPNVLVIILDTVRAASLSMYGYNRETTPELTRWAADGALFEWAFSTAPWTLPSHASIFSGHIPSVVGGDYLTPVGDKYPTLAEAFRQRGYQTAGFVANLRYASYESGLNRGFTHYDDYTVSFRQVILHSNVGGMYLFQSLLRSKSLWDVRQAIGSPRLRPWSHPKDDRRPAPGITKAFLEWQAKSGPRPFFVFLNYMDAHKPYQPPPPFDKRFSSSDREKDLYEGTIAYLDKNINGLLNELRRRGVLDNTIVIISSDHGELFGEHNLKGHANSLYARLLRVPLVIRYPVRVPSGVRIAASVTLRDLPATILDLAGITDESRFPGSSLAHHWSGTGELPVSPIIAQVSKGINQPAHEPVSLGPMTSMLDEQLHYIRRGDGREELYRYRLDPAEEKDLSGTQLGRNEIPRYRSRLANFIAAEHAAAGSYAIPHTGAIAESGVSPHSRPR